MQTGCPLHCGQQIQAILSNVKIQTGMKQFTKWVLAIAGILTITLVGYAYGERAFDAFIDRLVTVRCIALQDQSVEYKGFFYLTQGEKEGCDSVRVFIDAPVKTVLNQ